MAESFIQLPPDSSGKLLRTVNQTINAQLVNQEGMLIASPTTADIAAVKAASTAVGASDPCLAVGLSPNSPLPAGTAVIGHVITDSGSVATVTQGTAAAAPAPWYASPGAPTTSVLTQAVVSFSSNGSNTIVAGSSGKTIRIFRLLLVFTGACTATLQDTAGTPAPFTGAMTFFPGGSLSLGFEGDPYFVTAATVGFAVNISAGVQVSGSVWYVQS